MVYCQIEPTYLPLGFSIAMKHFFNHKCSFNNNINNNKLNNRTTRTTAAKAQQKQRKQHHEKQQQCSSFPEILTLSSACNSARLGRRSLSSVCDFEFQDLKFKSYHHYQYHYHIRYLLYSRSIRISINKRSTHPITLRVPMTLQRAIKCKTENIDEQK